MDPVREPLAERAASRDGREVSPDLGSAASLLARDIPTFAREAKELVKLEAKAAAKDAAWKGGISAVLGYLALLGVFFLACGAAFAISSALERAWAGPLIVGGAFVLLAGIGFPVLFRDTRPRPEPA